MSGPCSPCHVNAAIANTRKGSSYDQWANSPRVTKSQEDLPPPFKESVIFISDSSTEHLLLISSGSSQKSTGSSSQSQSTQPKPKCCISGAPQDWKNYYDSNNLRGLGQSFYNKPPGDRYFDRYSFERVVKFDEFTGAVPLHQWNAICYPSPPLLEVKGAKLLNAPSHYIVLSNLSIDLQNH
ncbi:hypothetical protein LOD99_6441 [Oopsacas minuta]|uniref:Uncharacterized protein n=1 Tax=Oopsacas minuta TaxID=111878 RepID=A0AAV7JLP5_9METZ|nr:hypothetical protein LOD99_6441 [Oopsacas minuta]